MYTQLLKKIDNVIANRKEDLRRAKIKLESVEDGRDAPVRLLCVAMAREIDFDMELRIYKQLRRCLVEGTTPTERHDPEHVLDALQRFFNQVNGDMSNDSDVAHIQQRFATIVEFWWQEAKELASAKEWRVEMQTESEWIKADGVFTKGEAERIADKLRFVMHSQVRVVRA